MTPCLIGRCALPHVKCPKHTPAGQTPVPSDWLPGATTSGLKDRQLGTDTGDRYAQHQQTERWECRLDSAFELSILRLAPASLLCILYRPKKIATSYRCQSRHVSAAAASRWWRLEWDGVIRLRRRGREQVQYDICRRASVPGHGR